MIFIELQKNIEVLKNDNEFIMHYSFHFWVFEPQIAKIMITPDNSCRVFLKTKDYIQSLKVF